MTQAYPLQWPAGWPRTPSHQRNYNWQLKKATCDSARRQLYHQLDLLDVGSVVLSCNIPIRNDGEFYASMKPDNGDPGIAVYFQLRGKPMSMARDCYDNVAQNLRSLGMAVEHLRGLERHGGASMMERAFSGFTALPPPSGQSEEIINWRDELEMRGYMEFPSADQLAVAEARYRTKAKSVHSDQSGDDSRMIRLNAAIAQARAELKP